MVSHVPAPTAAVSYTRHRFPAEIISHCVWLYHRFGLSLRDVQELLAERGVAVTYETIHQWCRKVGPTFAAALRRRRPRPGDTWHVDEVQLTMNGRRSWLWRAVDQDGMVLAILVQTRRNQNAAATFLRRVIAGCGTPPRVVSTDTLASYPPAIRRVLPGGEHRRPAGRAAGPPGAGARRDHRGGCGARGEQQRASLSGRGDLSFRDRRCALSRAGGRADRGRV